MGNLNVMSVTLFVVGTVLVYSAIKNKDPREVVRLSLQGKSPGTAASKANVTLIPNSPVPGETIPGQQFLSV